MSDREREQWNEARAWIGKADEDLRAAAIVLGVTSPLSGIAAFHCQQAVEKLMKGLLAAVGIDPPRSHDLGLLADLVGPRYRLLPATSNGSSGCERGMPCALSGSGG
ncbi:MAG: HEPN domain-containing protein [Alphaproteobacteria bacterium]|nr:HEPN domain-containing protein [Alphaproteobacteria bacterium]